MRDEDKVVPLDFENHLRQIMLKIRETRESILAARQALQAGNLVVCAQMLERALEKIGPTDRRKK
jgi:hypothetical protein